MLLLRKSYKAFIIRVSKCRQAHVLFGIENDAEKFKI